MPDIDPAALSRPSVGLSTPILSSKSLSISAPGSQKFPKSSQIIPARIDLEPLYGALKSAVGPEKWVVYKEATGEFLLGRLSQAEYAATVDPILEDGTGDKEHFHNQLIAALYGNVTREMPDQGPAPWVSANDKPSAATAAKGVAGDAAERRLKGDVMQLPARDRRRIKDLAHNDVWAMYDPYESLSSVFTETRRRTSAVTDVPPSAAGGINKMNFDLEIRKRFAQPLAVESGEFPDVGAIGGRMLPFCYEAGLVNGHTSEAPQLMSIAVENFIKEALTQMFSRTRSNGPGDSGSAGVGVGLSWIQTHKYKRQLRREEDAALRGEVTRDKSGMLPVEAKAANERGPLSMAEVRLSLELADSGMAMFPVLRSQIMYGYREGELEHWSDYTWLDDRMPMGHVEEMEIDGADKHELLNGFAEPMEIDNEIYWEGADMQDMDMLDGVLDSCLAVGT